MVLNAADAGLQLQTTTTSVTATVTVRGCFFEQDTVGIDVEGGFADVQDSSIEHNGIGVFIGVNGGANLGISGSTNQNVSHGCNNIDHSASYGVENKSMNVIMAQGNWWGNVNGPTLAGSPMTLGDLVSANVNFTNFRDSPVSPGLPPPPGSIYTIYWTGCGDGFSWNDPGNWSLDRLPSVADDVYINAPNTTIVHSSGTVVINSLYCNDDLLFNGTLSIAADSQVLKQFNFSGTFNLGAGASFDLSGGGTEGGSFSVSSGATFDFVQGNFILKNSTFSGDGTDEVGSLLAMAGTNIEIAGKVQSSTKNVIWDAQGGATAVISGNGVWIQRANTLTWVNADVLGHVDIVRGAILDILNLPNSTTKSRLVGTGRIDNFGETKVEDGKTFTMDASAVFNNEMGATFTLFGDSTIKWGLGITPPIGTGAINNKSGAAFVENGFDGVVQVPFKNAGLLEVKPGGMLALLGFGTSLAGTFMADANSRLLFEGGYRFENRTSLTGDGKIDLTQFGAEKNPGYATEGIVTSSVGRLTLLVGLAVDGVFIVNGPFSLGTGTFILGRNLLATLVLDSKTTFLATGLRPGNSVMQDLTIFNFGNVALQNTVDLQQTIYTNSGITSLNGNMIRGLNSKFLNGGTLVAPGTISAPVLNSGTIEFGNAFGTLTIEGDYTQGRNGVLILNLGFSSILPLTVGLDQVVITGKATLGGTLQVQLLNGFIPPKNMTWDLLTCGSILRAFKNAILPNNTTLACTNTLVQLVS
jgi:hypothetical protein